MISMISMISKISMISIDFYYQLIKCQTKVPFLGKIFTIYENLVGLRTTQRSTALNTMRKRLSLVLRSVAKRKLPLFQNILIRRTLAELKCALFAIADIGCTASYETPGADQRPTKFGGLGMHVLGHNICTHDAYWPTSSRL